MAFFSKKRIALWIILLLLLFAACQESKRQKGLGYSPEEQYFRQLIENSIGLNCNRGLPYIREVKKEEDSWVISLNADTHSDVKMIRGIILFNSFKYLDLVFRGRNDFEAVTLQWYFPLKIGRDIVDQPIIKIKMKRATEEKTDWNLVLTGELPTVVDEYWEESAIIDR